MPTRISVNGRTYTSKNGNITINGDKIVVDGEDVTPKEKEVYIIVNGDVDTINAPGAEEILVNGDANKVITTSGDVTGGDRVTNDIKTTSGDVRVNKSITGDVTTMSGDVNTHTVLGNVKTMSGDISGARR